MQLQQGLIGHFAVSEPKSNTNLLLTVGGMGKDLAIAFEGFSRGQRWALQKRVSIDWPALEAAAGSTRGATNFPLSVGVSDGSEEYERTLDIEVVHSAITDGRFVIDTDIGIRVVAVEHQCNPFWLIALIVVTVAVAAVLITGMLTCSDVSITIAGSGGTAKCGAGKFDPKEAETPPFYPTEEGGGEGRG